MLASGRGISACGISAADPASASNAAAMFAVRIAKGVVDSANPCRKAGAAGCGELRRSRRAAAAAAAASASARLRVGPAGSARRESGRRLPGGESVLAASANKAEGEAEAEADVREHPAKV